MAKIKLLIITAYFPPIASVASQRLFSFVKYLPSNDYEIKVIAHSDKPVEAPALPGVNYEVFYLPNPTVFKRAQFDDSPPFIIHKARAIYNRSIALIGVRSLKAWEIVAIKQANKLITDWQPDLILGSFPPAEVANTALILAKQNKIKLITDLRDGITTNSELGFVQRKRLKDLETRIANYSDIVLSVSAPILFSFNQEHNFKGNLHEVRNGFDFNHEPNDHFNSTFTIAYGGTFYGHRMPNFFFEALILLLNEQKISDFKINFLGVGHNFPIPDKLKPYIQVVEKLSYIQSVESFKHSDALLLIIGKSKFKGVYTGKLFDYLGSLKPIIALVDKEDVAAQLIKECNAGFIADSENIEEIKSAILHAYETWRTKTTLPYNVDLIMQHHRRAQAARLDKHIKKILNRE
jgi:hypothetical protein